VDDLLKKADQAMYAAKQQWRKGVIKSDARYRIHCRFLLTQPDEARHAQL
jgi:GGDEF domain-containing protein